MTIETQPSLLIHRRTKIVATLGPSSSENSTVRALINAGVNVFRLNMSHGNHEDHATAYHQVRTLATELEKPVAIFADLCGPKIRSGRFKNGGIELIPNTQVTVTTRDTLGETGLIPSQYKSLSLDVNPGDHILLDDGKLELSVESITGDDIECRVIYGGLLKDNKGINLPGVNVSAPSLTDKDKIDAEFALDLGVEFLALSFVRRVEDVDALRSIIDAGNYSAGIISKFEKPEAMANATAIIRASEAIMVARGDLGVELSPEQVPIAQRKLIDSAKDHNRPAIAATQSLESMMTTTRPSRAEVSDISQAVVAGADAVMLSGETAAGAFPIQTVEMMSRIICQTEAYLFEESRFGLMARNPAPEGAPISVGHSIAQTASDLAKVVEARAIISLSHTGMSAIAISSARPSALLLAISSSTHTYRRLNLQWGTLPILSSEAGSIHPNKLARRVALESGIAKAGDYIVLVRGFSAETELNTPSVTLLTL